MLGLLAFYLVSFLEVTAQHSVIIRVSISCLRNVFQRVRIHKDPEAFASVGKRDTVISLFDAVWSPARSSFADLGNNEKWDITLNAGAAGVWTMYWVVLCFRGDACSWVLEEKIAKISLCQTIGKEI